MRHYLVIARTEEGIYPFSAIVRNAVDAMDIAYDAFGPCSVCVRSVK